MSNGVCYDEGDFVYDAMTVVITLYYNDEMLNGEE